jgi:hypothetical protein
VPKSSTASERRTPAFFYAALDGWIKGTQVQAPYPCPNSSGRMVFADEVLHIHGSAAHRLSVHGAKQRLFADRIFLAHAASLRQTSFFARWKFRGFLHSFFLKGAGLDAASADRPLACLEERRHAPLLRILGSSCSIRPIGHRNHVLGNRFRSACKLWIQHHWTARQIRSQ